MQNVLLQGFMYITAKHICFYSYLPKKTVYFPKSPCFRIRTHR
jgi:sterol 3beta-glucosyltransferase